MVGPGIIAAAIGAAIIAAVIYFRKEIGQAGSELGMGAANFGSGISSGISSLFSPQFTPKLEPTIGLNLTGVLGTIFGQTTTDRTTGRVEDSTPPPPQQYNYLAPQPIAANRASTWLVSGTYQDGRAFSTTLSVGAESSLAEAEASLKAMGITITSERQT